MELTKVGEGGTDAAFIDIEKQEVLHAGKRWYLPRDWCSQVPLAGTSTLSTVITVGGAIVGNYWVAGIAGVALLVQLLAIGRIQCLVPRRKANRQLKQLVGSVKKIQLGTEEVKEASRQVEELTEQLQLMETRLSKKKKVHRKVLKENTKKLEELQEDLEAAQTREAKLLKRTRTLKKDFKHLKELHGVLKTATEELLGGVSNLKELNEELDEEDLNLEELKGEVGELKGGAKKLDEENDELSALIGKMSEHYSSLSTFYLQLKDEKKKLKSQVDELSENNDELKENLEELNRKKKELKKMNLELKGNLEQLQQLSELTNLLPKSLEEK